MATKASKRAGNTIFVDLNVKPERGKPRGNPEAPQLKPYQFQPGQSGNPGGRPKGTGAKKISEAYSGVLSQDIGKEMKERMGFDADTTISWAEAIAIQTCRKAVSSDLANPNFTAIQELRETTEGKTPDKSEVSGAGGTPLNAPSFSVNFVKPMEEDGETLTGE